MILAGGNLYQTEQQHTVLNGLEAGINRTLMGSRLEPETVIAALDALGQRIDTGVYDALLFRLPIEHAEKQAKQVRELLRRENLEYKLHTELPENFLRITETAPPLGGTRVQNHPMPLGVLFHIAAGNVDGLPVYSVVEGLLTGNINLLKLPQADQGLSLRLVQELMEIEPALTEYIYVFDTPSDDLAGMQKLANVADGIVVWGGDAAVQAVRRMAPAGVKLIEWGHRLSFAYVAGYEEEAAELSALADHLMETKGLLCSSCQTIFVDTESMDVLYLFCNTFLPYLEQAAKRHPAGSIGTAAEMTLKRYNDRLEALLNDRKTGPIFRGEGCSLTAYPDSELELSGLFGHLSVKRLPRRELMNTLRRKKGYLQTAGLLCPAGEREELSLQLLRCGVNRVTRAGSMSHTFLGEAHDGEYPLLRYLRMTNTEKLG